MTRDITTKGQHKFCSYHMKTRKKHLFKFIKFIYHLFHSINVTILYKISILTPTLQPLNTRYGQSQQYIIGVQNLKTLETPVF